METDNISAMYEAHVVFLSVKHQRLSEVLKRFKAICPGTGRPNSLQSNPKDSSDDIAEHLRLASGYFTS